MLDFLSAATCAVLMSFTAVEGLANATIDESPEGSTVEVQRKGLSVVYGKDEMERRLQIDEKLLRVMPMVTGAPVDKGGVAWAQWVHLRRLRDELVHLKKRGYSSNPDDPGPYGHLIAGRGEKCVQDAVGLIMALRPDWIPERVRPMLEEESAARA